MLKFCDFISGVQYKATVEYAPSKSVPKPSVKDGRDGTIFIGILTIFTCIFIFYVSDGINFSFTNTFLNFGCFFADPEYLEFLKLIAEPFENQRSAGNQLKIKETDQMGNG